MWVLIEDVWICGIVGEVVCVFNVDEVFFF